MKTRKILFLLTALLLCFLLAACGAKEESKTEENAAQLRIQIVNRSGESIGEVYLSPAQDTDWGSNRVKAPFQNGDERKVDLGIYPKEVLDEGFNILVYDTDGELFYDNSETLLLVDGDYIVLLPQNEKKTCEITRKYVPSDYDDFADNASAEAEQDGDRSVDFEAETYDISPYVGSWKYDEMPFYMTIGSDFTWSGVGLYGEALGPGLVQASDEGISLLHLDGSDFTAYRPDENGALIDPSGHTLSAKDEIILLPRPEDPLTETVNFTGDFSAYSLRYPKQLFTAPHSSVSNSQSFVARMGPGTDDTYCNFIICFQAISGYDPYLSDGAAKAKPYMKIMLENFQTSMLGDTIIETFGTNFQDKQDHYSIVDYLWLDGSIFNNGPSYPVRGCFEVRYYGPTGYAMVIITLAPENRIRNYYEICNKVADSCNYTAGWSTAPKTVPSQPARSSSSSSSASSAFFWYDEDGDVWFWNGEYNEFIGFGYDYYVGSDGMLYAYDDDEYWDWEDYYDDYDPWSDPGDTWDDYEDYEDYDEWYDVDYWDDWDYDWDYE